MHRNVQKGRKYDDDDDDSRPLREKMRRQLRTEYAFYDFARDRLRGQLDKLQPDDDGEERR